MPTQFTTKLPGHPVPPASKTELVGIPPVFGAFRKSE
jgi:hypothetical protein